MSEDHFRLEVAERHLTLIQGFFPRIDTKVSALFAISSGQIAVATLNLSIDDLRQWYIAAAAVAFLVSTVVVHFSLYNCTYPHLGGGSRSLIYFSEIAKRTESQFIKEYSSSSITELHDDFASQIWRNSEIVAAKYKALKTATHGVIASLVPWGTLLLCISLSKWHLPALGG